MLHHSPTSSLPHIIGGTEELRLSALATAAELTGHAESGAKALLAEMGRAHVVADSEVPRNVVRMYSFVEFEIDDRHQRPVRLVYPAEADISRGKISILTPIGAALIGLAPGQAMMVEAPDGKMHQLRVLSDGAASIGVARRARVHSCYLSMKDFTVLEAMLGRTAPIRRSAACCGKNSAIRPFSSPTKFMPRWQP